VQPRIQIDGGIFRNAMARWLLAEIGPSLRSEADDIASSGRAGFLRYRICVTLKLPSKIHGAYTRQLIVTRRRDTELHFPDVYIRAWQLRQIPEESIGALIKRDFARSYYSCAVNSILRTRGTPERDRAARKSTRDSRPFQRARDTRGCKLIGTRRRATRCAIEICVRKIRLINLLFRSLHSRRTASYVEGGIAASSSVTEIRVKTHRSHSSTFLKEMKRLKSPRVPVVYSRSCRCLVQATLSPRDLKETTSAANFYVNFSDGCARVCIARVACMHTRSSRLENYDIASDDARSRIKSTGSRIARGSLETCRALRSRSISSADESNRERVVAAGSCRIRSSRDCRRASQSGCN